MKLSPEEELALLRAFAKSKQYEFRGFTEQWLIAHPEVAEEPVVVEPIVKSVASEVAVEPESETETVEEKPKRKRKATVDEDAST